LFFLLAINTSISEELSKGRILFHSQYKGEYKFFSCKFCHSLERGYSVQRTPGIRAALLKNLSQYSLPEISSLEDGILHCSKQYQGRVLTPEDIKEIIFYLGSIAEKDALPASGPEIEELPWNGSSTRGEIYYKNSCAQCHKLYDIKLHLISRDEILKKIRGVRTSDTLSRLEFIGLKQKKHYPIQMPPFSKTSLPEDELSDITSWILNKPQPLLENLQWKP
jgi:cytochrome c2